MIAFLFLCVLMMASGALGYIVGRRGFEDRDPSWIRPERRRWRP